MSTITKESITDTIEGLEHLANSGIQSVYIDMAIAGMRRLLASLEAEAVYQFIYNNPYEEGYTEWLDCNKDYFNGVPEDCRRILYTAPPAPVDNIHPLLEFAREYIESWDLGMAGDSSLLASAKQAIADSSAQQLAPVSVPDEIEPTVEAIKRVLPTSNPDEYAACIGADMWNACRAAMLQGKAENEDPADEPVAYLVNSSGMAEVITASDFDGNAINMHKIAKGQNWKPLYAHGNSPVVPDGWVACSERMPDGMQTVITSNGFDIGQGWWDGEGWNSFGSHDVVPGEVTHWMPLPAAPQQEVK